MKKKDFEKKKIYVNPGIVFCVKILHIFSDNFYYHFHTSVREFSPTGKKYSNIIPTYWHCRIGPTPASPRPE
jgi:hypothetical protein